MELINKNEVIAIFDDIINDSTMPLEVKGFCIGAKNDINRLKPVEERPQGEWIFDSEFKAFGNPYGGYKCSCCCSHSSYECSFCKDCGADMRGGRE